MRLLLFVLLCVFASAQEAEEARIKTSVCANPACSNKVLANDDECGWIGCRKCPASNVLWFCVDCDSMRLPHERVCKGRRQPLVSE
jgi:hypothetical protein